MLIQLLSVKQVTLNEAAPGKASCHLILLARSLLTGEVIPFELVADGITMRHPNSGGVGSQASFRAIELPSDSPLRQKISLDNLSGKDSE